MGILQAHLGLICSSTSVFFKIFKCFGLEHHEVEIVKKHIWLSKNDTDYVMYHMYINVYHNVNVGTFAFTSWTCLLLALPYIKKSQLICFLFFFQRVLEIALALNLNRTSSLKMQENPLALLYAQRHVIRHATIHGNYRMEQNHLVMHYKYRLSLKPITVLTHAQRGIWLTIQGKHWAYFSLLIVSNFVFQVWLFLEGRYFSYFVFFFSKSERVLR